jgi:predicted dehydrogenase
MKRKIRFGVIGCGRWGRSHARVYKESPYSELVAVCDLDGKRAQSFGEEFSVKYFTDYHKMLETEELDAVGIVTPDFAHAGPLIAAANRGVHILCEKPLVTDEEELEKVLGVIHKRKIRIMVDYHNRWDIPFVMAKEKIQEGKIGTPISGYAKLNDSIVVPAEGYISWAQKSSVVWFLGSHTVDAVTWLFNDRIHRVYAVSHSGLLRSMKVDCVDTYLSTLEFEKGGIAQIENGWIEPKSKPSIFDFRCEVLCSGGMVTIDLCNTNYFQIFYENNMEHPDFAVFTDVHGVPMGFAIESIRDFVKRLYFDEEFIVPFEESVNVNRVLFAILKSAEKREPVLVSY